MAPHHLMAACRFAARVRQIERDVAPDEFMSVWDEIIQNALGVATLTVASLESYANQFHFDGQVTGNLSILAAEVVGELIDREPILSKYKIALAIKSGKRLASNSPEVQNVQLLIKLRNAIVHFRPEWFCQQKKHLKLSKQLTDKFQCSKFLERQPIFPSAWASGDFVVWALCSTKSFIEYFCSEAELENPLNSFNYQLKKYSEGIL